jgi:uncharacterized membrane protein
LGAVTPLGTLASLAGALVIGAGHAALRLGVAGLAGSLADSALGATLQAVYVCPGCGQRTEDRRHAHGSDAPALSLVRGRPLVTNDTVNLGAALVGALTGGLLHHADTALRRESRLSLRSAPLYSPSLGVSVLPTPPALVVRL